ncbi:MAG: hypothetical protein WAW63_02755, partial [Candidatus Saccharimonadales bacterium]
VVWGNGGRAAGVTYEDYEAVEGMLRDLAGKPLPSINRLNLPDGTHTRKATEAILRLAGNQ